METRIKKLLEEAYLQRGNDLQKSIELAEEALKLSEENRLSHENAQALSKLALFHMIKGNYHLSTQLSEQAIRIFESLGDERGMADARYNIASVHYKTDNYHLGLVHLIQCLSIYKKYNDSHNLSRGYKTLGTIYEYFGDTKNAINAYQETIKHAQLVGDKSLESNAYNPYSGILIKQGDPEKALEMAELSIKIKREENDRRGYAFAIYARAKVHTYLKNYSQAESDFLEALSIHQVFNELLGTGMAYRKLGEMYLLANEYDKSLETLQKAKDFSYKYHIAIIKYKTNYHLYQLYKKLNHSGLALQFLEEYLKQKDLIEKNFKLNLVDNFDLLNKIEAMKHESMLHKERAEMLQKKNQAEHLANVKQDFLSTMSHEIRTPLNAVITIAGMLDVKVDQEEKELIQSLKFAANNLLLLINDILDFTKLESGKMKLEKRPVRLHNTIRQLVKTYERLASEKGLELSAEFNGISETSSYEMDETRFSQIMINLIGNAIKYTDKGKIKIRVNLFEKNDDEHLIRFSVEDTGAGISPADQEVIFNSFSQIQNTRTRKQGGSGLGLSIVKKLVELHDSTIKLNSREKAGSVFYFDLKLKPTQYENDSLEEVNQNLDGKLVLLVEDNPINAMVANKLLKKWGIETELAINGNQAIEKVKTKKYDCILMDIHMPEMDGFEATQWIRQNDNPNKDVPVIALTADITAEAQTSFAVHFQNFLRKPIEPEKLFENLKRFMN